MQGQAKASHRRQTRQQKAKLKGKDKAQKLGGLEVRNNFPKRCFSIKKKNGGNL